MDAQTSESFNKLMDAIKNADISLSDRLKIMSALAEYIASK